MNEIRVLTVDDNHFMREVLATMIGTYDDLKLVGEAHNGREALAVCARVLPDVVLMDIFMPEMNGIEATKIIHELYPMVSVVAFTSDPDMVTIEEAIEAGAIGYLLKSSAIDEIADGLRKAAQHKLLQEHSH
jgi:two-component system, NarL family, response regulator LiaR